MLSGLTGLGMAQPNSLDSLFRSAGTNSLAGVTGLHTGPQSANGANGLFQLTAVRGGQQQSVIFQPAQLLQVWQALAQQQAAQVATQQLPASRNAETH